jgi:site-specific DNA recombinase
VRQIFAWIGRDRASIRDVCRRLMQAGERTRSGQVSWTPTTVWGRLKNPAYRGRAAFGKTRAQATEPRLRPVRGQAGPARRLSTAVAVDPAEWISVPVPALVSADLFLAVQDQLRENQQRRRAQQRGTRYLLQGLVCCACCGYAFYGTAARGKVGQGQARTYGYYRCTGTDAHRFGGASQCANTQVRAARLEAAVWAEVCALLQHPQRRADEYQQRLVEVGQAQEQGDLPTLETQIRAARQGMGRLIDSYAEGLIDKSQFEPRITRLKARVAELEAHRERLQNALGLHHDLQVMVGRLDEFAARVRDHLDEVDWAGRQTIIRTRVKRVDIDQQEVRVVFRVTPEDATPDPTGGSSPHCTRRGAAPLRGAAGRAERRMARRRPPLPERDLVAQARQAARGGVASPVGGQDGLSRSRKPRWLFHHLTGHYRGDRGRAGRW